MTRLRWPFLVALASVLIGAAAWQIVPRIEQRNRDQQAKAIGAQEEVAAARLKVQMEPAVSAIGRARLPGVTPCRGDDISVPEGVICASSLALPANTTVALKQAFAGIGATGLTAECRSMRHSGPFCRITGQLLGETLSVQVLPATPDKTASDSSGSSIVGGLGSSDLSIPAPSSGTPIRLPARLPS